MADAAIGATIQVVLETVTSLAADHIGLFFGFKDELKSLKESVTMIQAVLADAEAKQVQDQQVKLWLKRLEGVAFEADNVFDELNYEVLCRQVKSRNQQQQQNPKGKVCFFFSFSYTKFVFRWRMASKIRDINTKLKKINQEAVEFRLIIGYQIEPALPDPATAGATTSRQTDSVVVPNVIGRANDESKIVEMLLSPSDKVVSVIPIVGMAGVGKTTLAKSIYNNPRIDEHFDAKSGKGKKVWVCVAKEINIVEILKLILVSLSGEKVELDSCREAIVQKIKNELEGKRCFLVLDDVWNKEESLWDDFFNTLKGLKPTNGSRCLVTTRLQEVANAMSGHLRMNDRPYKLQNLTNDDCWSIIKRKVIAAEEIPEALKKQILSRCDGLPLAATLFGSLLAKGKEKWPSIVKKSLLDGLQNGVEQVIKVSFDYLSPASVKKCFAYCSIFPQDAEMEKDLLIELWMAEGFLQPDPENERLEDIGDEYFRNLLQSSLLEEVNEWGTTCYKMHDLVHDFAKSLLNQDRYLLLDSCEGMAEDIIKKNSTSLRTLFLEGSISDDVLSKFKYLHILVLSGEEVKDLPASIGKLIHLRFLGIFYSEITILPQSLCKLYNLQTLRIADDVLKKGLPNEMNNLINLRHLYYYDTNIEFQMPSEMGRLTRLQTLKFFSVGQEDGRGIEELENLKDLKGSLEIRNLQLVNGKEGAEKAKLSEKPNLSELKYLWGSGDRESNNCDKNVLEGLQPHRNLQELEIENFMGDQFPRWFIHLSALVELKFIDCKRCSELPALGQLPSLETLVLRGLENIKSIGLSFYGISSGGGGDGQVVVMPSLKYLSLEKMNNLVEWKDEGEVRLTTGAAKVDLFPVLEILQITDCSQLTSAPSHFPSIEKLDIKNNCHISLLEKIVSSITTLSSFELRGGCSHDDGPIKSLNLVKRRNSNNLEEDIECSLSINGMVPSEMLERLCHLPSLRDLELAFVDDLTRLACGTSLKSLTLHYCYDLRELPHDLDKFQALRNLSIVGCDGVEKLGEDRDFIFTSLEKLKICYCYGLTSLPGKMLESCASLRILEVFSCNNLVSFPLDLRQTPSLEILNLSECPKLMIANMPKGFDSLTSLRRLTIGPFSINETTEFDWSKLISSSASTLTYLEFYGLRHVESLPEQLQDLTSLTELCLRDFGIEALPDWIGKLASLENLRLFSCENLQYLPSTDAMRRLTKLTSLEVGWCPLLKERCNSQSGPNSEWPKISHIRNLGIFPKSSYAETN